MRIPGLMPGLASFIYLRKNAIIRIIVFNVNIQATGMPFQNNYYLQYIP
jgi:hypothetical protein